MDDDTNRLSATYRNFITLLCFIVLGIVIFVILESWQLFVGQIDSSLTLKDTFSQQSSSQNSL